MADRTEAGALSPSHSNAVPGRSDGEQTPTNAPTTEEKQPPSRLKRIWTAIGLDPLTLLQMFKGSIPPTIGIAIYQARGVRTVYGNTGYLVAITSVLALCIMPRGKFLQTLASNLVAICLASAVNLLALFCVVKARIESTPPGPPSPVPTYNATANTVCAIWLIFQTYVINAARASRPQLQFPVILYSIFTIVLLTYGVTFTSITEATAFVKSLLETFLTGMGLATAVHFVVFPLSSRKVVMKEWTGYFMLLNGSLKAQLGYMASIADIDPRKLREEQEQADHAAKHERHAKPPKAHTALETPAALKYLEVRQKLVELHTKIDGDITPAKREIALGKLESHDLTEIWKLLKHIFLPVLGLGSMVTILDQQAEERGWARDDGTDEEKLARHRQLDNLHFLIKELQAPFSTQVTNIEQAIQHIMLTLELIKPPKKEKQSDEENAADSTPRPGTSAFTEAFKTQVDEFYASKEKALRDWCHEHNVDLPDDFFQDSSWQPPDDLFKDNRMRQTYQRQLFFILYLEYLLWRVSTSVLDLMLYLDKRKQDGIFKRNRVIFPGSKTLYKWLKATFGREDLSHEDSYIADWDASGLPAPFLGEDFDRKKDPEHLPPRNAREKVGNALRVIPKFFRSEESLHGARVAAATMSVGIICYVSGSQSFFLRQRFLWALIMVAISMTRTAGQSILQFGFRVIGTTVATIGAYIVFYIVDGKTAGVIVFLWLWIFLSMYIVVKHQQFAIVGILALVTVILIIGYELQAQAVGVKAAESNGQPYYPTYELAPYRLAAVIVGLFVAFIWTIFPFPVSESTIIRKDCAAATYLLCEFYTVVHESVSARVTNTGGDMKIKGTHAYNLEKARTRVFAQLLSLLMRLRMNTAFSKFQVQLGGRFPRHTYEELIACLQRLVVWMSMAAYTSTTFQPQAKDGTLTEWSSDFRQLLSGLTVNSNKVTSLLSLMSSSLANAQPLPPYLNIPEPFQFVKLIESVDKDILSIRHIAEPEYSAFAVLQIVSVRINTDLGKLVELTRDLVGEIDFTFHALNNSSIQSIASSSESTEDEGKVQ